MFQFPRFGECLASTKACSDLAWMYSIHDKHCNPHEKSVKDIDERLVNHYVSIMTLNILDNSHDRSNKTQNADQVERMHMLLPGGRVAFGGRFSAKTRM